MTVSSALLILAFICIAGSAGRGLYEQFHLRLPGPGPIPIVLLTAAGILILFSLMI